MTIDGANAANFAVTTPPGATTLAPGATTTFAVRFTPPALGNFTAGLHIASNDADESPFDLVLTGSGVSNADLQTLAINPGAFTPAFAAETLTYWANYTDATTSVSVTATLWDVLATMHVRVNGGAFASLASGVASAPLALTRRQQRGGSAGDGGGRNDHQHLSDQCQPGASAVYLDFPGCFPAQHADVESGWSDPRRHSVHQPRTAGGGPHPGQRQGPGDRRVAGVDLRHADHQLRQSSTMGRGAGRWPRCRTGASTPPSPIRRRCHRRASSRTTRLASTSSLSSSRRTPRLSRPAFKIKLP